jgi:hypothetical protein
MLYIISVLLVTIIVILILINAKLKLLLKWAESINGRCGSAAEGAWSASRVADLIWSDITKKP